MRTFEARDLLLAIASALREHPPSFTFEVITAATGGAEPRIQGAPAVLKLLDEDARSRINKAAHDIDLIASEVIAAQPDRAYIERLVEGLPETLVGSVVLQLIAAILAACSS